MQLGQRESASSFSWSRSAGVSDALEATGNRGYYAACPVPSLLDLALPPRLIARALDDLHAIAEAARRLPTIEVLLTEQFEILNRQADELIRIGGDVIEMGREANAGLRDGVEVGRGLHERGAAILDQGARLEALSEQLLVQGRSMDERAAKVDERAIEIMEQAERVIAAAREVAERGAEVAAALPALEQMASATEPLQPAIERFSRLVDRLPGGKPPREGGEPPAS